MAAMLFASTELAARIERAECALIAASGRALLGSRPDMDGELLEIGGGVAAFMGPGSPLNKVCGLGFGPPLDAEALDRIEAVFAARDHPVQVELSTLADPGIGTVLTRRGYLLMGFENVLGRPLDPEDADPAPRTIPGLVVRPSPDGELDLWLDTVITAFLTPDAKGVPSHETFTREDLEGHMRDASRPLSRYLALRSDGPAGGASMRIDQGIAQLCGAATLPHHRRQGVQAALLHHRLADATAAGCDVAVVTTQPGSTSQKNVQRKGFQLLYSRAVLVKD